MHTAVQKLYSLFSLASILVVIESTIWPVRQNRRDTIIALDKT